MSDEKKVKDLFSKLSPERKTIVFAFIHVLEWKNDPQDIHALKTATPEHLRAAAKIGAEWADESQTAGRTYEAEKIRDAVALLESLAR